MDESRENDMENTVDTEGSYRPSAPYVPPDAVRPYPLGQRDRAFGFIMVICSILMVSWGLYTGFASGMTAAYLMMFVTVSLYLYQKGRTPGIFASLCGAFCVLLSPAFSLSRQNMNAWILLMLVPASVAWSDGLVRDRDDGSDLSLIKELSDAFFSNIFSVGLMFKSAAAGIPEMKRTRLSSLKGILLALPLAAALIALLVSSDAAFEGFMRSLAIDITEDAVKLILGLALSVLMISYMWGIKFRTTVERSGYERHADERTLTSFLLVICAVYAVYLMTQGAYFFSAFSGILPDGFTAAEYARRGFFEMCVVAMIDFIVVILSVSMLGRRAAPKGGVLAACLFINLFTVIIASTALSKMFLYISYYGMTYKRIVTSVFMFGLIISVLVLTLRLFRPGVRVLRVTFVCALALLTLLTYFNMDSFSCRYNYEHYMSGELSSVDPYHMYISGSDGIEYLILLSEDKDLNVSSAAKEYLRMSTWEYWDVEYDADGNYVLREPLHERWYEKTVSTAAAQKMLTRYFIMHPEVLKQE